MIKIWCEECNGSKQVQLVSAKTFGAGYEIVNCGACDGKGYTEHEGSVEDLECARIERKLIEKHIGVSYYYSNYDFDKKPFTIMLYPKKESNIIGRGRNKFEGLSKLEALQQAEKWIDEREVK